MLSRLKPRLSTLNPRLPKVPQKVSLLSSRNIEDNDNMIDLDNMNGLDESIDTKLTDVVRTIFSKENRTQILNFRKKIERLLEMKPEEKKTKIIILSKSKKKKQTPGKKKKNKNKTQKSLSNENTTCEEGDEPCQKASMVEKLFYMIIQFQHMVFSSTSIGIKKLLTSVYKIYDLILSIKAKNIALILIVLYLLYSNPYTRFILILFVKTIIYIWNMGDMGDVDTKINPETIIKRHVDDMKETLYYAAVYLVQHHISRIIDYHGPQIAEKVAEKVTEKTANIAKVLLNDYLGDITKELVELRVKNNELSEALNEIRADTFNNVRRLARIESGVFTTQSAVERLEDTIHKFDINNKLYQKLMEEKITTEIDTIGRIVMHSGNDAQLARLESLLIANLRTTDAGRLLNNLFPSNRLEINGVPTSNVFTAAAALGAATYTSRFRPRARISRSSF